MSRVYYFCERPTQDNPYAAVNLAPSGNIMRLKLSEVGRIFQVDPINEASQLKWSRHRDADCAAAREANRVATGAQRKLRTEILRV